MKKKKRLVVVLGMHRSGTSVLTRGLQVMGVNLGDRLMPPTKGENDKGFWEDLDLIALNIAILKSLDSNWHFLTPIHQADLEMLRRDGYALRALKLLKSKTLDYQIFGFKDPRVAKLLPFWSEIFTESGLDVCYVVVIRHPISVSKSLAKRNNLDVEKSYILWLEHVLGSLVGTIGKKRVLIDYDEFLQSPEIELAKAEKVLQLKIDPFELEKFKTEFLDEKLRHTIYDTEDLALDATIPPLIREVYQETLKASRANKYLESKAFKHKLITWNNEFLRMQSALILVDNLTRKINSMHQQDPFFIAQMAEKEQQIANLEAQISDIYSSSSWRVTAPMRAVSAKLKEIIKPKETRSPHNTSNSNKA